MITKFDKTNLKTLHAELRTAVEAIAAKHGIVAIDRSGSYSPDGSEYTQGFRFRTVPTSQPIQTADKIAVVPASGLPTTVEARLFAADATQIGLDASDYHRTFTFRGNQYRVLGIKLNRFKFPVSVERLPDGKKFKMPVHFINPELATRL